MLREVDDLVERNNMSYEALMDMTPFEFKLLKMIFIEKIKRRSESNGA